jgi:hypothetical protein
VGRAGRPGLWSASHGPWHVKCRFLRHHGSEHFNLDALLHGRTATWQHGRSATRTNCNRSRSIWVWHHVFPPRVVGHLATLCWFHHNNVQLLAAGEYTTMPSTLPLGPDNKTEIADADAITPRIRATRSTGAGAQEHDKRVEENENRHG